MCKLEGSLKLCTCNEKESARLDHYWVFYRFNAEKHNSQCIKYAIAPPLVALQRGL